ncbi:type II toxin-antitoxin system VapC family toxin [Vibrio parahaemolyticus]|nr:type II toxin-antitoxin system VapC family toxin [Vibrio parahaemolyticus]
MEHLKVHLLDASALIKLFLSERGSDSFRKYFADNTVFWTTSFCVSEVLGVFKRNYLKKIISKEDYLAHSEDLMAYLRQEVIMQEHIDITDRNTFQQVELLVGKYQIDVVDAYQLTALRSKLLCAEVSAILVTADVALYNAAVSEGIEAVNILGENFI